MACGRNCSMCGKCSAGASPLMTNLYSGSSASSSSSAFFQTTTTKTFYSSHSSSSQSYSGFGNFGSSAYSAPSRAYSIDAMVSNYQGQGNGPSGRLEALSQNYVIDLDSKLIPIIYENRTRTGMNNTGYSKNTGSESSQ
ncbi:MAG: hypothetical protein Q8O89_02695, partial [Nanoarchaeota archaeon]|nr:hypothetical protein [Nanoarchaeota archaeon]